MCLNNFQDIHRFYDTRYVGCMWVFEEEYYIIHDYLLPGFYIATQLFFTMCFTLMLVSLMITAVFLKSPRDDDRYIVLLLSNGTIQLLAGTFQVAIGQYWCKPLILDTFVAFCGLIAVIIFGARGDGRDWMPNWEHNDMGWAFALGVIGVFFIAPAGVLFMIEARRERYKRLNEIGTREASAYMGAAADKQYAGGHTDI